MYDLLIADDSAAELDCLVFLINRFRFPFRVHTALNGEEALDRMKNQSFDILLTDIQMPFLDGLELTRQALFLNPALKVVIISAHEDFAYAKAAITLGVQEYLLKPIDPDEFQRVLNGLLLRMKEEKAQKRMEDLQTGYIKNHLLLQLLNSELPEPADRSRLLLETYFQNCDTLLLIELKKDLFASSDCPLEIHLQECFSGDYHYLNLTPSLEMVLFQESALLAGDNAESVSGHLIAWIQAACGTAAKISFGTLPALSMLRQVYQKLEELLENAFLYPKRSVFPLELYEEIQKRQTQSLPSPMSGAASGKIKEVKRYIYQNYGSDLSLDRLAGLVYMHPDYLSRLFKKETGCNLNQFIKKYRMEKAKELLMSGRMKVSAVGALVGYSNSSYFCRTFNEYFGTTPEKFREKRGEP